MYITEQSLKDAFANALHDLIEDIDEIKGILLENVNEIISDDGIKQLETVANKISEYQSNMMELYKKKIKGELSKDEYDKKALVIQKQIDVLNEKKAKLEEDKSTMLLAKTRIDQIEKLVNIKVDGFDEEMFITLIEEIIIRNRYELEFKFKCGISKTIVVS